METACRDTDVIEHIPSARKARQLVHALVSTLGAHSTAGGQSLVNGKQLVLSGSPAAGLWCTVS